ncbi:helix-turn-helix transcriptional regulator [Streptomyces malaysiensis]|uniref:AraC family transcriptional regulator n=1 Tax=Streptomyces malaysiensis subsp. samsunensis TaxID=459658 RepID=A0A9X2M767_STRMQ|nr:AraC family transcriptional regulator [Streptomyces samsunensis]MCQ8836303.1 AraC family transcriptional regulator [Streptomyces samsunensis]
MLSNPQGMVEFLFPVSGTAVVEQAGQRVRVDADATVVCGLDRPLGLWHSPGFEALALVVPESRLAARASWFDQCLKVFEGRRGLGRVAFDLLRTVSVEGNALVAAEFDAACERALDLACLAGSGAREADSSHRSAARATIRRFVADHVADPELDGHMVAAALGWSRRYLQAMLHDEGLTLSELIRNARLDMARVRLEQEPALPIGWVAVECRYGSHAAFSTAFRSRFGMTPREVREGQVR